VVLNNSRAPSGLGFAQKITIHGLEMPPTLHEEKQHMALSLRGVCFQAP